MATTDIAKIAVEPYPCDGCAFYDACKHEELACHAFAEYVSGRKWRGVENDPSEWWFVATMSNDGRMLRELAALERNDAAA